MTRTKSETDGRVDELVKGCDSPEDIVGKHGLLKRLKDIHEPAVIFLDAHYSGGSTARGDTNTPLLDELEIVRVKWSGKSNSFFE